MIERQNQEQSFSSYHSSVQGFQFLIIEGEDLQTQ